MGRDRSYPSDIVPVFPVVLCFISGNLCHKQLDDINDVSEHHLAIPCENFAFSIKRVISSDKSSVLISRSLRSNRAASLRCRSDIKCFQIF